MAELEDLTVTLPSEIAALVKSVVETGDYSSASEVVRAALHDWRVQRDQLASLRTDIGAGLADLAARRVETFDATRIVERGRKLSAARSPSA